MACSSGNSPVDVSEPAPDGPTRRACETLAGALPDSLGKGLDRRKTKPESPLTAAWGSPAAVLRCGVPVDPAYKPGDQLIEVEAGTPPSTARWYSAKRGDRVVWSTPLATVHVELTVPEKYQGAGLIARLTPAVSKVSVF